MATKTTKIETSMLALAAMLIHSREQHGYSRREVAKKIGFSATHLLRIERGDVAISVDVLFKLCVAYGLPPGILVEVAFAFWRSNTVEAVAKELESMWGLFDLNNQKLCILPMDVVHVGELIHTLCPILVAIVLAQNPKKFVLFFEHDYAPLVGVLHDFASKAHLVTTLKEREALLSAITKTPVRKLTDGGIVSMEFLEGFIRWRRKMRRESGRSIRFNWRHWQQFNV